MLYREIIELVLRSVQNINAMFGQNVEFVNVKVAVLILTTGFRGLNLGYTNQPVNFV